MSKLDKIKAELAKLLIKYAVVKTDNGVLEYEGEDLTAGMDVYTTNEDGERVPAENGEYTTEDAKVITVENGKVISIIDTKAEVDNEVTETVEEEVKAEEEQPQEQPTEEQPKEDVTEAIENIRKEINELYKIVDSILEKIGETRREADERFSKIEKMSSAKPATEEFEQLKETPKNNGSKLDKFLSKYGKQ